MKKISGLLCSLILLTPLGCCANEELNTAQVAFAHQLAVKDHFNEKQVRLWLLASKPKQTVLFKTKHPTEDASWHRYRQLFITQKKIQGGVAYFHQHKKTLNTAYKKYQVDPATIVAIIAMESFFGQNQGAHSAVSALNTLAFYSDRRQQLFQGQLRSLFLLARQLKVDPLTLKSSYSGALGQPQFMPSTYLDYAVSASGKTPNLFVKADDIIFSIANYLHKMGWKKDKPVALRLTKRKKENSYTLSYVQEGKTVSWKKSLNFNAVHRYNQSNKYVLAVSELANEIRHQL